LFYNKPYEIHIDNLGKIIKEEIGNDEPWSNWKNDKDDEL